MQYHNKLSKTEAEQLQFDVIVIGVGAMGAAACYYLAKQGAKVLGLEQFDIPNEMSSHTGQSRLIRKAYFEHPDYVPLLQQAYQNWKALEQHTGEQVYYPTGLLYMAPANHELLQRVKQAAGQYQVPLETPTAKQVQTLYPAMHVPNGYETLLEPEAGFLRPEKAIHLYASEAIKSGATIKSRQEVKSWQQVADGIEVVSTNGQYFAKKLVISAGAWAGKLLPVLQDKLTVTRQVLAWANVHQNHLLALDKQPCWMIAAEDQPGGYYGFPILPNNVFDGPTGFKLAYHYPGSATVPEEVNRRVSEEEITGLITFMQQFFPGMYKSMHTLKTCLYTNSPDEHFILDFLPDHHQNVIMAAGFSGHGFKFASVIGEIISDLTLTGRTSMPIGFLGLDRFSAVASKTE